MPEVWDDDAGKHVDEPWSQSDIDWYRSLGANARPDAEVSAIPLDDQPCGLCHGKGVLREDSGYGFETIIEGVCMGTGSRASVAFGPQVEHHDQILRTIIGLMDD